MNANTSIEGNGRKELKVTKTNDVKKLIDDYFNKAILESAYYPAIPENNFEEDIEYVLSTHDLIFDIKEQTVKSKAGEDEPGKDNFVSSINVLESGKRDFVLEELLKGAGMNIKLAELRKVKAKVDKIKKEDAKNKLEESDKDKDRE